MANLKFDKEITALLVIDPYNDFISEGGKIWDRLKAVAEANDCVPHMLQVLNAARKTELRVFYALHHRYRPGDYETWKYIAPIQKAAWSRQGLRIRHVGWRDPPRVRASSRAISSPRSIGVPVVSPTRIWICSSRNTAFTSSSSSDSSRTPVWRQPFAYAAELGYEVTMVKDATASYSDEHMHAALEVNIPNYASAIVTTNEVVDSISSL